MHHLSLADELAELRAEIVRLKAREAVLRAAILKSPAAALVGRWSRLEIETRSQSVFDQCLLPESLRADPRFRTERQVQIVRCLPLHLRIAPRAGWPIRRDAGAIAAH